MTESWISPRHLATLARYNRWANRRLFAAVGELDDAAYRAPRAGFFGSIHATLNHILVGDRLWLCRLAPAAGIPEPTALDEILYDAFDPLRAARAAEDTRLIEIADAQSAASLAGDLVYRTVAGEPQRTPVGLVFAHLINHATHHRGQAHAMLSGTSVEPPPLDLIYFLREPGDCSTPS